MTDTTCEVCRSRPARLTVVRRRGGDILRTLVCSECAGHHARLYVGSGVDLRKFLDRLQSHSAGRSGAENTCPLCGASQTEIVTEGRPGCCLCYEHFQARFNDLIRQAQNRTRHVGKTPDL